MKILLCGWGNAGAGVLWNLADRRDVTDLAVCTHDDLAHDMGLVSMADGLGVWSTTEDVNRATLPFTPDIIASVYYRYLIRPHIIDLVGGQIFNAHPSLLPRHRGCGSITWSIIEGDQYAGVTFHYIDQGIDTGRVLLQTTIQIEPEETQATLADKCAQAVIDYFPAALELVRRRWPGVPQVGRASYHRRETPYGGEIDPEWDESRVGRFVRAMTRPPLPYATYQGRVVASMSDYRPRRGR